MTLSLVDILHTYTQMPSCIHTHTHRGWMEVPASWLPRQLITEPSTPTKERESLHSNILIPLFTGCSRGDCRENEREFVLPSASAFRREKQTLHAEGVNAAEVYAVRRVMEMQIYAFVIYLPVNAASPWRAVVCHLLGWWGSNKALMELWHLLEQGWRLRFRIDIQNRKTNNNLDIHFLGFGWIKWSQRSRLCWVLTKRLKTFRELQYHDLYACLRSWSGERKCLSFVVPLLTVLYMDICFLEKEKKI